MEEKIRLEEVDFVPASGKALTRYNELLQTFMKSKMKCAKLSGLRKSACASVKKAITRLNLNATACTRDKITYLAKQ